ncbi:hypothetical protein BKA69DRAFT_1061055 [Paraphysoderma sedebokerense]|nr:hypothetical protein BKA69DRAFT_1061055 [Paraphysoderma sedebokerense]
MFVYTTFTHPSTKTTISSTTFLNLLCSSSVGWTLGLMCTQPSATGLLHCQLSVLIAIVVSSR